MAIVQRMRNQLRESMKARDAVRTGFLRYWIAQFITGTGKEVPDDQAIKKMRGVLREAKEGITSFSPEELVLIEEWLPPTMGREQIQEALTPIADRIKAAPKEGHRHGHCHEAPGGPAGGRR